MKASHLAARLAALPPTWTRCRELDQAVNRGVWPVPTVERKTYPEVTG